MDKFKKILTNPKVIKKATKRELQEIEELIKENKERRQRGGKTKTKPKTKPKTKK